MTKRPGANMSRANSLTLGSRYLLRTDDFITIKEFKEKLSSAGEKALLDADEVLFDGERPTFVDHVPAFWIKAAHGNSISYIQQAGGSDDDTTEKLVNDWCDAQAATMHIVVFLVSSRVSAAAAAAAFSVSSHLTIGLDAHVGRRRRSPSSTVARKARTVRTQVVVTLLPHLLLKSSSFLRRVGQPVISCVASLWIANSCMYVRGAVGVSQHQKGPDSGIEYTVKGQVRIFCPFSLSFFTEMYYDQG